MHGLTFLDTLRRHSPFPKEVSFINQQFQFINYVIWLSGEARTLSEPCESGDWLSRKVFSKNLFGFKIRAVKLGGCQNQFALFPMKFIAFIIKNLIASNTQ